MSWTYDTIATSPIQGTPQANLSPVLGKLVGCEPMAANGQKALELEAGSHMQLPLRENWTSHKPRPIEADATTSVGLVLEWWRLA